MIPCWLLGFSCVYCSWIVTSFQLSLREDGGEILIIIKGWSMCKWGRGELTKASECSQWGAGRPGRNQKATEGLGSHTDPHQEALGRDLIRRQATEEMHFLQGLKGTVTCLFYLPKPLKNFGLRARLEKRIQHCAKTLWTGQTVFSYFNFRQLIWIPLV